MLVSIFSLFTAGPHRSHFFSVTEYTLVNSYKFAPQWPQKPKLNLRKMSFRCLPDVLLGCVSTEF